MIKQKNKVGRPSLLRQEMLDKAKLYMLSDYENVGDAVPSHAGLCCYLGVVKSTVYEFAKVDNDLGKQFSNTLEAIKIKQERMLLSGGLKGDYNANITKLMLANHGYSDKQELEHSGNIAGLAPIIISQYDDNETN